MQGQSRMRRGHSMRLFGELSLRVVDRVPGVVGGLVDLVADLLRGVIDVFAGALGRAFGWLACSHRQRAGNDQCVSGVTGLEHGNLLSGGWVVGLRWRALMNACEGL
jgi:hypothetical protein